MCMALILIGNHNRHQMVTQKNTNGCGDSSATNSTDKGEPDLLPVLTPSVILATASAPASYQSPNFNLTREGSYKQLIFCVLKTSVFPKCKFITHEEELHHAGSLYSKGSDERVWSEGLHRSCHHQVVGQNQGSGPPQAYSTSEQPDEHNGQ